MSLRKKIVLCVAITAAMGIALMYCAAHYSASVSDNVLDVESVVNVTDNILDYNNITMFSINSRGRFCRLSDQDGWFSNSLHCVGDDVHVCKISDVINLVDFWVNLKGDSNSDIKRMLAELNSGKTVICNTFRLLSMGYNCKSFNDSVIPEYALALLKYDNNDLLTLARFSLKDDIIKYSRYRMSSYVGERCAKIHDTSTFVKRSCKLTLGHTSKAKLEVDNGEAGKCTEVVNKDLNSSVLSCESRGEHLLDHVFSESGHYICSLKQGHLEL